MLPITNSERETIVFHKQNGETNINIARWVRVSVCSVARIWRLYLDTGSYEPRPQNSGRKPKVTESQMEMVAEKIAEQPDITLGELIDRLSLGISESALCRRVAAMGLSYKKKLSTQKRKNDQM